MCIRDRDKIESAYRFLLADLMPFGKNARITLEHGGTNQSTEHYETVTYWSVSYTHLDVYKRQPMAWDLRSRKRIGLKGELKSLRLSLIHIS